MLDVDDEKSQFILNMRTYSEEVSTFTRLRPTWKVESPDNARKESLTLSIPMFAFYAGIDVESHPMRQLFVNYNKGVSAATKLAI